MFTIAHRGSQARMFADGSTIASIGRLRGRVFRTRAGANVVFHDRRSSPDTIHHSPNPATWLAIAP